MNKLVCIDKYVPSEDTTLRRNKSRVDVNLDHNERAALDCWFYEEKDDVAGNSQNDRVSREQFPTLDIWFSDSRESLGKYDYL